MIQKNIIRVGLAGNPNTGKTTLFNAITGAHQKTGNYAGVTVEKKEGRRVHNGIEFIFYDLPGIYSLSAYSLDEVIARDFILDEKPDIIVDVLDATNLERNLYLCLQIQELGIPMIGAINISDQAKSRGIIIDEKILSALLGMPIVSTIGTKGSGIEYLLDKIIATLTTSQPDKRDVSYGSELETEIGLLICELLKDEDFARKYSPRWLAIKLLEKDSNAHQKISLCKNLAVIEHRVLEGIRRIESHFGRDSEIVVSEQRYGYVHGIAAESIKQAGKGFSAKSEYIDNILMDRFLGLPVFLLILWAIFQITFTVGRFGTDLLNFFFAHFSAFVSGAVPDGVLHSLLIDGIIGGLSGVLSFVPQIAILFLFLSFLEDTGYMARAAFIMDKVLHLFGLHGQSFFPLVLGFGCSVPAVMASRTLKSPRDRIITVLVTPFMTCGAKLVVLVVLAGTFFRKSEGTYVLLIYVIGVALALLSSLLFRKTVLKGDATPFVMELPPYRMPTVRGIAWHVADKTGRYLKKAGTVLLAASILIWVIVSFPKPHADAMKYDTIAQQYRAEHKNQVLSDAEVATYINAVKGEEFLAYSIAGRIGKAIEPIIKPLGFDWKIGISAVTGFAAKEAVVSTLGILYKVGSGIDEKSASLRESLLADKTFNPLVAFVLMLFTLIVPPCIAALSTIRAEIGWRWLFFAITYMLTVAWVLCFAAYQTGKFLGLGTS